MATEPLYRAGLVATTKQRPLDVLASLAEAMAGKIAYPGNKLTVWAGSYIAPSFFLEDKHFAGSPVSVTKAITREDLFDTVTGKLIDQDQGWKPDVDMPRVDAAAYVTLDNGQVLPLEVVYEAVHHATQCQQLSAVMLREARQSLTVVARFKLYAFPVEVFDIIGLTNVRRGWNAKPFMVLSRKYSPGDLIELMLRETDASVYAFGNAFDLIDAAPNTSLPLAHVVAQLTGLVIESGTEALSDGSILTRTRINWAPATDKAVTQNGKVEIQYLDVLISVFPPTDWPSVKEEGSTGSTVIAGLLGGRMYVFRGRFINSNGVRGHWSIQVTHTVAKPPAIAGMNLFMNSSFEAATANIADNWSPFQAGTVGSVTHSSPAGIFGDRSQRIDLTNLGATAGDAAGYTQSVSVGGLGGKEITISVYAEGTLNAELTFYTMWYTSNGTFLTATADSHTIIADVNRYSSTFTVPNTAARGQSYIWIDHRPSASGAAFLRLDAAQFEPGSIPSAYNASAEAAMALATTAYNTAVSAATAAGVATAQLAVIADDNVLTKGEKSDVLQDYNALISAQSGIDSTANALTTATNGIGGVNGLKATYDAALAALTTYLNGSCAGWNTIPGNDIAMNGSTWRATWGAAYNTEQNLLNAIYIEASTRANWVSVAGAGKPADNASADLVIVARGQCVAVGNSVTKVGGANAWDSDAYSMNGFVGGSFAAGKFISGYAMFGLNSDPQTDQSYSSLDFAWYLAGTALNIYEGVTNPAGPFTWTPGDVCAIVYDGKNVTYMQNNTVRYQRAVAANLNLFLDTSFYSPTAQIDQLRFGPMSPVTGIDTVQLNPASATPSRQVSYPSGGTLSWGSGSIPGIPPQQQIGILSYTNNTGRAVDVEMSASCNATGSGGTGSANGRPTVQCYCDNGSVEIRSKVTYLGATEAHAGGLLTENIANGTTINFRLYAVLKVTGNGTFNPGSTSWSEPSMRLTAIAA